MVSYILYESVNSSINQLVIQYIFYEANNNFAAYSKIRYAVPYFQKLDNGFVQIVQNR